jgi:GDP-4-dehydro-6-deoxy-D-mannose reductase
MTTRVLVTGINGAIAPYVARHAAAQGAEVYGLSRKRTSPHSGVVEIKKCDITDRKGVASALKAIKPDVVFHLGGVSTLSESWADPVGVLQANLLGTAHFLEALRESKSDCRLVITGSREEYGVVDPKRQPITESEPLNPINPYGVAKAGADWLAAQYHAKYGVDAVRARLFNQSAPSWPDRFADSNWCHQIAKIEANKQSPAIQVGNLESVRDFTDCRDVAAAYWALGQKATTGEAYNICSGRPVKMADVLSGLLAKSSVKIAVTPDPSRVFADQVVAAWGDNSRIRRDTGWAPKIALDQTHSELLAYWRAQYSGGKTHG